jgi:hypothetical protein
MAFKLIESAQTRWRAVNAPHLVAPVRAGAVFKTGAVHGLTGHAWTPSRLGSLTQVRTLKAADQLQRVHADDGQDVRVRITFGAIGNIACLTATNAAAMIGL